MPRFAALDLGSNALRLKIVEADGPRGGKRPDGAGPSTWKELVSLRAPVRLGAEVFLTRKLTSASVALACRALREFRAAMDAHHVDAYRATATSAVREARNRSTLVERARREARIDLEVIEGVEEARLIQLAVTSKLQLAGRQAVLLDMGGGSTEVTHLDSGKNALSVSLPLGTVRMLETFIPSGQALDKRRMRLLVETIDRGLAEVMPQLTRTRFDVVIGTGGNLDTLADLCPATHSVTGGRAVDVAAMRALLARLASLSATERRAQLGLRPDRADTLVPATVLFLRAAEMLGADTLAAPGVGLKEGIVEELVARHFHAWDLVHEEVGVIDSCVQLGRHFRFDEAHGLRVAELAGRLFDQLQELHGLRVRDRLLLRAAAVLHDVGDFVRYDGHHKHSYYLIQHSDVMGLRPDERAVVANVARYHRKSHPDVAHANFRDLDKDARAKVRALAAILRIADALDREHLGKVLGVSSHLDLDARTLELQLQGDDERELEEWTVRAKSELFRDVFDVEVLLASAGPPSVLPSAAPRAKRS